jgi:hypothetical protein
MLVKVTGTNFVRDTTTMALINTNTQEKNDYQSKVRMLKTQKEEINIVKSEIDGIRNEMSEIKQMLTQLLSKGLNG